MGEMAADIRDKFAELGVRLLFKARVRWVPPPVPPPGGGGGYPTLSREVHYRWEGGGTTPDPEHAGIRPATRGLPPHSGLGLAAGIMGIALRQA